MAGESPLSDDVLTVGEFRAATVDLDPQTPILGVCGNLHVDGITSMVVSDDGVTLIPNFWLEAMEQLDTLSILVGEEDEEGEEEVDRVEVPEAR